jgi:hypothetical protein
MKRSLAPRPLRRSVVATSKSTSKSSWSRASGMSRGLTPEGQTPAERRGNIAIIVVVAFVGIGEVSWQTTFGWHLNSHIHDRLVGISNTKKNSSSSTLFHRPCYRCSAQSIYRGTNNRFVNTPRFVAHNMMTTRRFVNTVRRTCLPCGTITMGAPPL